MSEVTNAVVYRESYTGMRRRADTGWRSVDVSGRVSYGD